MAEVITVAIIGAIPAIISAVVGLMNKVSISLVHDAVNGGLQEAKDELKASVTEIKELKSEISDLKIDIEVLKKRIVDKN